MSKQLFNAKASKMRSRLATFAIIGTTTMLVGACTRGETTSSIPSDHRERHPIHLVTSSQTLDVFAVASRGGLDHRQDADVRGFARDYMTHGQGPLVAYLPTGSNGPGVTNALNGIRRALAGGGAAGRLQIAHYNPGPGASAAPIRLSFARLKAEVPSKCGMDNDDFVPSRTLANWENRTHYNFGCSYQRNLAAQIDDPRDLAGPRQEGPVDSTKRLNSIEQIRGPRNNGNENKPGGTSVKQQIPQ
jgi:pilus assembly protein CpaD